MMKNHIFNIAINFTLALLFLSACANPDAVAETGTGGTLQVVATTSIVADVVEQVGGESIDLQVLLSPGEDPHSYQPAPQDMAKVANADLVFINGAGLEEGFLDDLLENTGAQGKTVDVSTGIELLIPPDPQVEGGEQNHAEAGDPHTWTDPYNVMIWTDNIAASLIEADPENEDVYRENAGAYQDELRDLDAWIREQVQVIPPGQRKLVTDHQVFTYFADEYGFEQVGALIPGYSSGAEPSARELAELEDAIREVGVPAILVGNTVNPALAERVAADTGIELVFVYTGSLAGPEDEVNSYLDYIRYNVTTIVDALQ